MAGMKAGTITEHEGVGVVQTIGKKIRNLDVGDHVVIPLHHRLTDAITAYKQFHQRKPGWVKVELEPSANK